MAEPTEDEKQKLGGLAVPSKGPIQRTVEAVSSAISSMPEEPFRFAGGNNVSTKALPATGTAKPPVPAYGNAPGATGLQVPPAPPSTSFDTPLENKAATGITSGIFRQNPGMTQPPVQVTPPVPGAPPSALSPEEVDSASYQNMVEAARPGGAGEGQITFADRDVAGGPWKGTPSGKAGLDTGGVDIESIMSKFAGGSGTPTGTGLPVPISGSNVFSALLSMAAAIGAARTARADEATRWHRGIDMTKLVTEAQDKTREYGIRAPYYKAMGEHATAGAELARKQGAAMEEKPEAVMRKEHAAAVERAYEVERKNGAEPEEARRNAWAMADEQYPDLPSVKARRGNGRDVAPLREWFSTGGGKIFKTEKSPYPQYPDARKSPKDGKWYVQRGGENFLIGGI